MHIFGKSLGTNLEKWPSGLKQQWHNEIWSVIRIGEKFFFKDNDTMKFG